MIIFQRQYQSQQQDQQKEIGASVCEIIMLLWESVVFIIEEVIGQDFMKKLYDHSTDKVYARCTLYVDICEYLSLSLSLPSHNILINWRIIAAYYYCYCCCFYVYLFSFFFLFFLVFLIHSLSCSCQLLCKPVRYIIVAICLSLLFFVASGTKKSPYTAAA